MPCQYCGDSHSAFDPCPESIATITREDLENRRDAAYWKRQAIAGAVLEEGWVAVPRELIANAHVLAVAVIEGTALPAAGEMLIDEIAASNETDHTTDA